MLFNSYLFILAFLPIVLIGFTRLCRIDNKVLAKVWIILASWIFYGYYNHLYLLILIASIIFNYGFSRIILSNAMGERKDRAKWLTILAVVFNVAVLFYFKYFNFFIDSVNTIFDTNFFVGNIALPLGISFFTFQQISYVVDSYNMETVDYEFLEYCMFVSFFPQLVAGPIVLHDEIIPQFRERLNKYKVDWGLFQYGIVCFVIGLFKKVILADTLGQAVNIGYAIYQDLGTVDIWIIILGYTLQLFLDFSGYCDMATGIASMFGIRLPINFNSPYRSLSIKEFWNRWHITLNRFLTKYVYIPLGGNRNGSVRTCINLMVVFWISGIWHGANQTFILWGGLHGICIVLYRLCGNKWSKLPRLVQWVANFFVINLLWVFFRADTISQALKIIKRAFELNVGTNQSLRNVFTRMELRMVEQLIPGIKNMDLDSVNLILFLGIGMIIALFVKPCVLWDSKGKKISILATLGILVLAIWSVLSLSYVSEFLYFGF
jgi:D-alanyl-lipoteichoic acid acyltransferase DltB (MBOAT superfamily)